MGRHANTLIFALRHLWATTDHSRSCSSVLPCTADRAGHFVSAQYSCFCARACLKHHFAWNFSGYSISINECTAQKETWRITTFISFKHQKLLLMPKACTMDLEKYGDADAAQTCNESPIFRHVSAYAPFAFWRAQDPQVPQLSQCSPTAAQLPEPAMEPHLCENKLQAQAPTRNFQWVSHGKEKCSVSPG